MNDHFIQIDRCNAGVRLTCRKGDSRTGATLGTLVRQPWMNDVVWKIQKQEWLGRQQIWADSPVHAWKDHKKLGTVEDLLSGQIDETANHG